MGKNSKDFIKGLLPIGSVVMMKSASKKAMIFGVKQKDMATDVEYDYIGVIYPEGNLGDGSQFFFNHENIAEVFFRGYENEERQKFVEQLSEYYSNREDER